MITVKIFDDDFVKYRYGGSIEYNDDGSTKSVQYLYHFPNGYGASVSKAPGLQGYVLDLWELAVIKWYDNNEWHLCYDTDITDDIIGNLSSASVCDILGKIICLPTEEAAKNTANAHQVVKTHVRYL